MADIINELKTLKIIPVIKIGDAKDALPLARALAEGGLPCAEVTFRTSCAAEAIKNIASHLKDDMLVGAGTVLNPRQVDEAIDAGAKFIVSPGLNPDVVKHCIKLDVPVIPGVITPTEIELALSLGLKVVKFFPAEAAGGLAMLKALAAPYGDIHYVPTGGIGPENLLKYLAYDKVVACGGSWMVKEEMIGAGDFASIKTLTMEAVKLRDSIGNPLAE